MDFVGEEDCVREVRTSKFMEWRLGIMARLPSTGDTWFDGMNISTICGFPTIMNDTTLAVSSCDFLLLEKDSRASSDGVSASASVEGLAIPERESVSS